MTRAVGLSANLRPNMVLKLNAAAGRRTHCSEAASAAAQLKPISLGGHDQAAGEQAMARLQGTRLILAVQNLRAATDFYINVLGFSRDFGDESDGWSWLSRDNFRLGLGECKDAVRASELGDHSYVAYVNVDDVDGLYTEFMSRGARVLTPPETKAWGMREFGVQTPDGHRMTFGCSAE